MPSLEDLADAQTTLRADEVAWLRSLVADWQIVADLGFCDLVLWLPDVESRGHWAAAQIRPTTGPTTLDEDVVGQFVDTSSPSWSADGAISSATVEIRRGRTVIALLEQRRLSDGHREVSRLERSYRDTADVLIEMIRRAEFPVASSGAGSVTPMGHAMRVGDGFLRTDTSGHATYASPNALSAYRRLGLPGDLVGANLVGVTLDLLDDRPTDRSFAALFDGGETETEIETRDAVLLLRIIPLRLDGVSHGHAVLLRDVTDLRLRERELVSKDATIREIHHRVKNNLQTVAALLRLQGRRVAEPAAKEALREAEQRIGSIALVHETLSQSFDDQVDFDEIADVLLRTIPDVGERNLVRVERIGTFGTVSGELATTLAMVLTELVQNSVEHAFDGSAGRITVAVNRIRGRLKVRVSDDGRGLPEDFDPGRSLGLSIVTALVTNDLGGTLEFVRPSGGGAAVDIAMRL